MRKNSLLLLAALASAPCFAAVPSQFIAKQYTEGLGRAPDTSGWQSATNYALAAGCSANSLQTLALNIFQSQEYASKGYTPEEQILTAYRAIFSREPDSDGFNFWVNSLKSGHTLTEVIQSFVGSQEFASLVPAICKGYGFDPLGDPKRPLDIGSGTWTQSQLESCINNNAVCSVPPRTVVYLTSTLNIPAGKVLETAGGYDRTMYARQARLVRDSPTPGILIVMQPGSTVRNIWVTGGRDRFKSTLPAQGDQQANVFPNINYVGGNSGTIQGVRSDAPLSATHIQSFPVPTPSVPTSPTAFNGSVLIYNNLTTGYAQRHYRDGTLIAWADGISNHIMGATIQHNDIVDPTDVGIVIFGHDGATQASTASNNLILHSGHSAYGSLGLDTTQCVNSAPTSCSFSGTGFTNNTIFAGRNQHSDIMLFNGTGSWLAPKCPGAVTPDGHCGSGGQMSNNNTILNDGNQSIQVQAAIVVDGMLNAVTSGNNLAIQLITASTPLPADRPSDGLNDRRSCIGTSPFRNAISAGHASGNLQGAMAPYSDTDSDWCTGHDNR